MASTLEQQTGLVTPQPDGPPGSGAAGHASPLARLGRWTATHLRAVLLIWLVVIGTFGVFAVRAEHALAGAGWQDSTSQSVRARDIVQRDFAGLGATALQVVVVDHNGTVASDPAAQQIVARVTRTLQSNKSVSTVVPPSRDSPSRGTATPASSQPGRRPGPQCNGDGRGLPRRPAAAPLTSGDLGHPDRRQHALGQLQRRQPFGDAPFRDAVLAGHDCHPRHRLRESRGRRPPAPADHGGAVRRRGRPGARHRGHARLHLGVELHVDVHAGARHRLRALPRGPLPRRLGTQGGAARATADVVVAAVAETLDTAGKAVALQRPHRAGRAGRHSHRPQPGLPQHGARDHVGRRGRARRHADVAPCGARPTRHPDQRGPPPPPPKHAAGAGGRGAPRPDHAYLGSRAVARPIWSGLAALGILLLAALPVIGLRTNMPSITIVPASANDRVGYDQVVSSFGPGAPGTLQVLVPNASQAVALTTLAHDHGVAAAVPGRSSEDLDDGPGRAHDRAVHDCDGRHHRPPAPRVPPPAR